ncbi:hypothetical protein DFH06DRAFT_1149726 [Mycena polygramma]|nr:hypothetical protein DFH06DRAFT_1149726 [Mycena polygramma]
MSKEYPFMFTMNATGLRVLSLVAQWSSGGVVGDRTCFVVLTISWIYVLNYSFLRLRSHLFAPPDHGERPHLTCHLLFARLISTTATTSRAMSNVIARRLKIRLADPPRGFRFQGQRLEFLEKKSAGFRPTSGPEFWTALYTEYWHTFPWRLPRDMDPHCAMNLDGPQTLEEVAEKVSTVLSTEEV